MDVKPIIPGLAGKAETTVNTSNTALKMRSGDMDVFATPAMVALMEEAAVNALALVIPAEMSTVGTLLNVAHSKASPIGEKITAEAILAEVDGRRLVFSVSAYDTKGVIGEGKHERFMVDREKFLSKFYK